MSRGRSLFYLGVLFLQTHALADPPDAPPPISIHAVRVTEPITIDGILSEQLYQMPGFTRFIQRDPIENVPPSQRTEIWVGYDDGSLYIGARMYDASPDSIEQRLARKDAMITADAFTFYIDGYHDKRSGFYFGINAAGTMYDGVLYNDDWNDDSWDGIWEGKVHIDAQGWTAEMRIPYSQIRFEQGDGYHWAVDFKRIIARLNENDYVTFTPKNGSGFVSRFVDLTGVENIVPPRRLEVMPYITGKAEYAPHDIGDPYHTGSRYSPGLGADFKMGLGSNLTLDGAINPDFGQVEVDPAVVNLSDVETYYNEKRPFFLEGSNIFDFGSGGASNNWSFNWSSPTFFYSRRIGRAPQGSVSNATYVDIPSGTNILGAAKLSGKAGDNWSIGAISALTAREMADVDSAGVRSSAEVEPLTYYGVARAQKELNEGRQGIGMMSTFTQRDFSDPLMEDQINKNALMGGIDGWTSLDDSKTWVVTLWTAGTNVTGTASRIFSLREDAEHYYQRPDVPYVHLDSGTTSLSGYAGRIFLTKQKGNFTVNGSLGVISPGFDVDDMGFQWRTDVINSHAGARYSWTVPTSWYQSLTLSAALFRSYDFGGDVTWQGIWQNSDIVFPNFYEFGYAYAYNPQAISDHRTRGGPKTINPLGYEISWWLSGDSRKTFIPGINFDSYQSAYQTTYYINLSLDWKPASNIEVIFTPEFDGDWENSQWVGAFADPTATSTFGTRYVFGAMDQKQWVAGIRLNWAFTPTLSLQVYAQPLLSAARFSNFKELARAGSYDFNNYGRDGSTISYDASSSTYTVDPDGGGPAAPLSFGDPDFNVKSIRGDAVLRWEFTPGSTFYLVWTQTRENDLNPGDIEFNHNFSKLFNSQPDNIFLMKIAYWLNP
ncbi:MAG TPA: DUF5916 domain-containing protein [Bacteroidota bacterium]|nr:DUF5916 domain-containing protein [Bacteroidota bacterium]